MPVSTLACTSTIVKIRNADEILIGITPEVGDKTNIKFVPDPEPATIQKELEKYVSLKGCNKETISCKCVDIHVPVPMLKVRDFFLYENAMINFINFHVHAFILTVSYIWSR